MDRYTAAAMGQNISSIGDAFMQMNDPRTRAQAGLLRAQLAGQTAENEGRGITNAFLPHTLQSGIDQNLAAAQANLAQGRNYDASATNTGVRTQASQAMLGAAGVPALPSAVDSFAPVFTDPAMSDAELGSVLPPPGWQNGEQYPEIILPAGVPTAPNTPVSVASPPPQTAAQQFTPQQLAIFANVAGGGGANDMLLGQGRASALDATTELEGRQVSMAITGRPFNDRENYTQKASREYEDRGIASAYNLQQAKLENDNLQERAKMIAGTAGSQGSSSAGSAASGFDIPGTAPRNFTDATKAREMATAASYGVFHAPEDGSEDPFMTTRQTWAESVSNLILDGNSPEQASAMASQYHFGTPTPQIESQNTWRLGFGKDPSLPAVVNHDPIPRQAGQTSNVAGGDLVPERVVAGASMLLPPRVIAEMDARAQAAQPPAPAIAQGPLVGPPRPADPVPQTGPAKASDQFKAPESSKDQKERERKSTNTKVLKDEINALSGQLKNWRSKGLPGGGFGMSGPMAQGSSMNNDDYIAKLAKLKEMEAELGKLQTAPGQQTSLPVTISGIRQIN